MIRCFDYKSELRTLKSLMRALDLKAILETRLNVRERSCVSRPVGLVPYPVTEEETRVITSITHLDVHVFDFLYVFFLSENHSARIILSHWQ